MPRFCSDKKNGTYVGCTKNKLPVVLYLTKDRYTVNGYVKLFLKRTFSSVTPTSHIMWAAVKKNLSMLSKQGLFKHPAVIYCVCLEISHPNFQLICYGH